MKNSARRDQRCGFRRAESGSWLLRYAHIALLPPSLFLPAPPANQLKAFPPEQASEGRKGQGGTLYLTR